MISTEGGNCIFCFLHARDQLEPLGGNTKGLQQLLALVLVEANRPGPCEHALCKPGASSAPAKGHLIAGSRHLDLTEEDEHHSKDHHPALGTYKKSTGHCRGLRSGQGEGSGRRAPKEHDFPLHQTKGSSVIPEVRLFTFPRHTMLPPPNTVPMSVLLDKVVQRAYGVLESCLEV